MDLLLGLQGVPSDHLLAHSLINVNFRVLAIGGDKGFGEVLAYLEESIGFLL